MSENLKGLHPSLLWKHFEKILTIPHCSGNEKALGDYILSVAQRCQLPWKRDAVGNILVKKPATPGREKAETIILQGHLDMVCEKNSDVVHDFSRDPIQAEIREGWVRAKGTTLGSDNGIGLAASLAIMEETSLAHGPLEFLFTVDEETGLTGATRIEPDFLTGKRLLNLDSEEEGTFTIGCAGGADSEIHLPVKRTTAPRKELYELRIFGLRGGHSGIDIHQGRANAIKLMARMLGRALEKFPLRLVHIEGGSKRNAIPRECQASILVDARHVSSLSSLFQEIFQGIQVEYKSVEKDAAYSFKKTASRKKDPLSAASASSLLRLLLGLPHGVLAMHPEIPGLVETSTNLAIVKTGRSVAEVVCNTRSSIASALEAVRASIRAVGFLARANIRQPEGYPGWMPNLRSPLLSSLKKVYQNVFSKEPEVIAIHAGLECGILGEKFPGMDMISFGPTIKNPHSPDERVHIDSVTNFWKFLTAALEALS